MFIANHYSASLALESAINRIEINSLTINSKQISRWTLSSFSRSLFASLAFPVSTSQLDIIKANQIKNKNPYTVDSQCGQILLPQQKYVCVHSVTSCPSNFTCSHPVQPTGFCCPLCAELIKARFHSSSPEHEYRSIATLVSNLQAGKHEHVRYFVHNVTTVDYELIIVNEKSADAHHFANDVYNHLQKGA